MDDENIMTVYDWYEYLSNFFTKGNNTTYFTLGLEYLLSIVNISELIVAEDWTNKINKLDFINFMINHINTHPIYLSNSNYANTLIIKVLDFWKSNELIENFEELENIFYDNKINDFKFLIVKYNEYLDNISNHNFVFTPREEIYSEDYEYNLYDWVAWFHIRIRMDDVFNNINLEYINWIPLIAYLHK